MAPELLRELRDRELEMAERMGSDRVRCHPDQTQRRGGNEVVAEVVSGRIPISATSKAGRGCRSVCFGRFLHHCTACIASHSHRRSFCPVLSAYCTPSNRPRSSIRW